VRTSIDIGGCGKFGLQNRGEWGASRVFYICPGRPAAGQERPADHSRRCSTSCSNPLEKQLTSGRTGWLDDKFRAEIDRFRHAWTRCRRVRDREAPGSNPGPPTKIRIRFRRCGSCRLGAGSQPDHNFPDPYNFGVFRSCCWLGSPRSSTCRGNLPPGSCDLRPVCPASIVRERNLPCRVPMISGPQLLSRPSRVAATTVSAGMSLSGTSDPGERR
jgi:hypothetical protein